MRQLVGKQRAGFLTYLPCACRQVTKLYYASLEAVLANEEKSSGMVGCTALLSSSRFHRCLVACCVELVTASYRMPGTAFPKVR